MDARMFGAMICLLFTFFSMGNGDNADAYECLSANHCGSDDVYSRLNGNRVCCKAGDSLSVSMDSNDSSYTGSSSDEDDDSEDDDDMGDDDWPVKRDSQGQAKCMCNVDSPIVIDPNFDNQMEDMDEMSDDLDSWDFPDDEFET